MSPPNPVDPANGQPAPAAERADAAREHELLQAIIDAVPVMITLYEPDTKVLRLNPEFTRVVGWTAADAAGVSLMDECYPDPAYRAEVRQFMESCAPGWKDVRMRTRDGRDVETIWANIRLSDGRQVGIGLDVSERRRAHQALRESEERYRELFENANEIIYTLDLEGRITSVNRRGEQALGYERAEWMGRNSADLVAPEHHARLFEALRQKLAGAASPTVYEVELLCKDGRRLPVEINSRLIVRDGRPVGIQGIARDVGERRQVELALRRSETRFRKLVEQAPVSIQIVAPDGRVLRVNRAWEELWGATFADLADYNILRDPQIAERGILAYLRRALGGASVVVPPVGYVPDRGAYQGRERWVRAVLYPVKDDAGRVEEVVILQEDITEPRQAGEALRESEERLRLALDAGRCGVWDWDIVHDRVTWSERIYEFHGMAPGTFGGRAADLAGLIHPEDAARVSASVRRAVEQGDAYGEEFRIVRPSGEVRWLATHGRVIRDEFERPVRMLGATIDVTDRHAAEEALREADRRKDEFLAMLAHELRNPLAPIRTAAQVLRLRGPAEPDLLRAREMIERQVAHMARLVDDLLDVSRITRGKILLRKHCVDLVPVVRGVIDDLQPVLQDTGLTLHVDLPDQPLWVDGDPTRLAQMVGNLLHNANKFTDAGGRVEVRLAATSAEAVLTVRDTGIGMDVAMLTRLFEPFSQADRSLDRSRGGLGLGLALVKGLVELHGGTVRAASAGVGQGSEFTLRLPLRQEPDVARAARRGEAAPGASLRVVVIEDNHDTAESLRMLLELSGHRVAVAHAGLPGLQAARELRPDVVLCDIGLPGGMDGYAVARALRADPDVGGAVLIAISGYGQEEDQRRARRAGFDRHLTKPVDPVMLLDLLARIRDE